MLLVVCFMLLQMLQPFIHAHVEHSSHPPHTDHAPMHHKVHDHHQVGFHVADAHEELFDLVEHHSAQLVAIPHASHTIFVAPAITQPIDHYSVFNAPLLALYCLVMALILRSTSAHYRSLLTPHFLSFKRRLPPSRAPPV